MGEERVGECGKKYGRRQRWVEMLVELAAAVNIVLRFPVWRAERDGGANLEITLVEAVAVSKVTSQLGTCRMTLLACTCRIVLAVLTGRAIGHL